MRRIRYSVAASLDGYIAGPQGESDWIVMDPEIDFQELFGRFDTVLMGRRTFEQSRGSGEGACGMPGMKTVVVSTTLRPRDFPDVTVIGDDLDHALTHLCEQPGKDIWLFGGGTLFRTLLKARPKNCSYSDAGNGSPISAGRGSTFTDSLGSTYRVEDDCGLTRV